MGTRFLGIDFSGDPSQWAAAKGSRGGHCAVWIADVRRNGRGQRRLHKLLPVQALPGPNHPFDRLISFLRIENYSAAAIDAPFSVPACCIPDEGWKGLLAKIERCDCEGRPFPSRDAFLALIKGPGSVKPLRETENEWKRCRPRSPVWNGARPGTAFTIACLTLLSRSRLPIWPWDSVGPRIMVEAFPAAQLEHWCIPFKGYQKIASVRHSVVDYVATKMLIEPQSYSDMQRSGDALDAVISAFSAEAVVTGTYLSLNRKAANVEGWIAVLDDWCRPPHGGR